MQNKAFRALVILSFLSAPILSLTSAAFGGATRVRNIYGELEWVQVGNLSQVLGWVLLLCYMFLGSMSVISFRNESTLSRSPKTLGIVLFCSGVIALLSVLWNRTNWPVQNLLPFLTFCLCTFAAYRVPVPRMISKTLAKLTVLVLAITVIFAILNPTYSAAPCREDKCEQFGFLLNSFFPHENFLAMFLLASFPFLASIKRIWYRRIAVSISSILIYLTGSRVAYFALFVFFLFWVTKKAKLLTYALPIAIATSAVIFVSVRGIDFTDRGLIYAALWSELRDKFIFGGGPLTLQNAFAHNLLPGFLPSHEHGFAPHVITTIGVLGFLSILVFSCIAVTKTRKITVTSVSLTLLLPVAILFLTASTETPILLNASGPFSWAWYLFVSVSREESDNLETSLSS